MSVTYVNTKPEKKEITPDEVIRLEMKQMTTWEPSSDTWMFRYSAAILDVGTIISSLYIMNHYRRKLKLFSYGRPITFVPSVVMPTLVTGIFHQEFITKPLLLREQCPVCIQVRSATVQAACSVLYPLVASTISTFFIANNFATYRLPAPSFSNLGEYLSVWRKITRPISNILLAHIAFQFALSLFVTEGEAKSLFYVHDQINQRFLLSQKSTKSIEPNP